MKTSLAFTLVILSLLAGCRDKSSDTLRNAETRIANLEAQLQETRAQDRETAQQFHREKSALEAEVKRLSAINTQLSQKLEAAKPTISEPAVEDREYLVLKREHIPGQLVDKTPPISPFQTQVTRLGRDWERTNPVWRIYLRGVQTKREYPPLEIKESEYKHFLEGSIYTRADINRAKAR